VQLWYSFGTLVHAHCSHLTIAKQHAGPSAKAYSSRNAAYDLAKLKGKRLVQRVMASAAF